MLSFDVTLLAITDSDWLSTVVQAHPQLQSLRVSEMFDHASRRTADDCCMLLAKVLAVLWPCRLLRQVFVELQSRMPPKSAIRDLVVSWRYRGVTIELEFLEQYV